MFAIGSRMSRLHVAAAAAALSWTYAVTRHPCAVAAKTACNLHPVADADVALIMTILLLL